MPVRDEAARLAGEIAELRHAIHREPEIGLDLPKTQRRVLDALSVLTSSGNPDRASSTLRCVFGRSRPISGSR